MPAMCSDTTYGLTSSWPCSLRCIGVIAMTATIVTCEITIAVSASRAPAGRSDDADRRCGDAVGAVVRAARSPPDDHQRVGPQPDGGVERGADERDGAEQPRPGVPLEPEPRLPGGLGRLDQQRPEHGPERRREHDPAHRPAALVGLGEIGGGVAGEEVGGLPVAEHEQPDEEDRQRRALDADDGDDRRRPRRARSRAAALAGGHWRCIRRDSTCDMNAVPVVTVAVAMPAHGVSSPRMSCTTNAPTVTAEASAAAPTT